MYNFVLLHEHLAVYQVGLSNCLPQFAFVKSFSLYVFKYSFPGLGCGTDPGFSFRFCVVVFLLFFTTKFLFYRGAQGENIIKQMLKKLFFLDFDFFFRGKNAYYGFRFFFSRGKNAYYGSMQVVFVLNVSLIFVTKHGFWKFKRQLLMLLVSSIQIYQG